VKARAYVKEKPFEWCDRHAGDVVHVIDQITEVAEDAKEVG